MGRLFPEPPPVGMARGGVALTGVIGAALVLAMAGSFAFPAQLPLFVEEWRLSNTQAGWIAGIYLAGYSASVPVLVSLTDRVDGRRIFLMGCGITAVGALGFAVFAEGFWTAMAFRALAGVGLAGTYMPGLKMLVDRYDGPHTSRAVAYYTGCFSLGTAGSFLATGELTALLGWHAAFAAAAGGAALAVLLIVVATRPIKPQRAEDESRLLDFRPVLRNRAAMAYILGYGLHAWELFGFRSWIVAFLAFRLTLGGPAALAPTTIAMLCGLIAMWASIGGQELAARWKRRRVITVLMLISAAIAGVIGFTASLPYAVVAGLAVLYSCAIQADSAALTSGAIAAAEPGRRGATLAIHSLSGFGFGFVGPLVVGIVLDLAGGAGSVRAWGMAFASLGLVVASGPALMALLTRERGWDAS